VQLRTFYFDTESISGAKSEAWAVGGWAGVRSPWWGDLFQIGVLGYTSQKLYGPTTRTAPAAHARAEVVQCARRGLGALKVFDQTLTGYRQLVNRPYINPQDNRMVPNTFEAYTLTGAASGVSYTGGYIAKMKTAIRQLRLDVHRRRQQGHAQGRGLRGRHLGLHEERLPRMDEQYVTDLFNNFYVDAKYPIAIDAETLLVLGAQYTSQRSIGKEFIGDFSTYHAGVQAALSRGPFGVQLYYTQNGNGFDSQNPFGDHASYLNLMHVASYRRREDLGHRRQRQFRQPGRAGADRLGDLCEQQRPQERRQRCADSRSRRRPTCGPTTPSARTRRSRGWWPRCAAGGCIRTGSPTAFQLRAILNYAIPF
jgi:hypothetical protein